MAVTGFYVIAQRQARTWFLLGPYATQEEASRNVDRARLEVWRTDPWNAVLRTFTTVRRTAKPGRELKPGELNDVIGRTAGTEE